VGLAHTFCHPVVVVRTLLYVYLVYARESLLASTKGSRRGCRESFTKLSGRSDNEQDARNRVLLIRETNRIEKELSQSATFIDCFRGFNLRRTEICVVAYIIQIWGGGAFQGYSTLFFELAGLPSKEPLRTEPGHQGVCLHWHHCIVVYSVASRLPHVVLLWRGNADSIPSFDWNFGCSSPLLFASRLVLFSGPHAVFVFVRL
jgi:hypothetical protein